MIKKGVDTVRVKRFSTLSPRIARDAITRGYKIVRIAVWDSTRRKHYFLEK